VQNLNLNAGRLSRAQYQYTLQSADIEALFGSAPKMREQMAKTSELRDVTTDLQIANPQIVVDLDREKAANFGVSSDSVRQTLYNAFGTRQISTIYTPSSDFAVIMEANRDYQSDPAALDRLFVKSATGQNVPLSAVAAIRRNIGPLTINRQSQQPSVTISFNLAPGVSLGQAVDAIKAVEKTIGLPSAVTPGFSGSAAQFQDSLKGQGLLILAAVLVIYIVLGVLYESFIHPITILSGLPSAGLGALLALQYFNLDLSVIAIIGILMLVGIVKKNAIMMVDFALELRSQGLPAREAIREAALVRFRPIMMTTFAALFGTLPIALGSGAGSELRQPLGIAVVGGLAVSQILTLFITPVVYIYLDKIDTFLKGKPRIDVEPLIVPGE
jgi:HAE1 family hydrophobic/amphiphilic exporter-1